MVQLICALSIGVIVSGCAKEGMPPGGIVDTELPSIVEISPEPRATNVHTATPIVFRFSEAMDHASVERAIFFTPDIGSTFRYYWRGREFHLDPMVAYRENTTIVVTVGADAADLRRNRLGTSVTLAFSTGAGLDDAEVSGAVLNQGEFAPGAWIWIYPIPADPLSGMNVDPSPFLPLEEVQPLYITQADDSGRFRQGYIADGMYRIFAFEDSDGNRRWDRESDPLAVPPTTIGFSEPGEVVEGLMLNLAPRDTTGPSLRSASAPNRDYVRLRFSEPPAPGSLPAIAIDTSIEEGMEPQSIAAITILRSWIPWDAPASMTVQVDGMAAEQRYRVTLLDMVDAQGNPGRVSARPVLFTAPSQPDTSHPRITAVVPGDSTRTLNQDQTIRLTFTTGVDTSSVAGWSLTGPDSTGRVELEMQWLDSVTLDLTPTGAILPDAYYQLRVPARSLTSWAGV
ncbi:Ig-like domain-containing protein, partial [Candidatus Zixiibacteriota bacterium]